MLTWSHNREGIIGIILIALGLILYFFIIPWQCESQAEGGAMSTAFFPKVGTALLIILSGIFTVATMREDPKPTTKSNEPIVKRVRLNVLFAAISIALYLAALSWIGFLVATPPFLILLMIVLGARLQHWIAILITTVMTTVGIWFTFIKTLGLPMP